MAKNSYSRYSIFKLNNEIIPVPGISISKRETDQYFVYDINRTRLDRISAEAYGDDTYGWIIMLANPEYYFEFDIPYGAVIRVPYPLQEVLPEYQQKAIKFIS
jgi:hypothetical protein